MPRHAAPADRPGQHGAALLWVVMLITMFAGVGGYMVKNYSASRMAPVDANLATRAELLAESGYRFLSGEYFAAADDAARNQVLNELHGQSFETGGDAGTFSLSVTSYFYRLTSNPSGGTTLSAAFVGNAGASVPSTGYVSLGTDSTIYEYTAVAHNAGTGVYSFTMAASMPSLPSWTTVRPVIQTTIGSTVSEGGNLSLDSGQGAIFPTVNGVFWISGDGYRYESRSGDTLYNITAPHGRTFTAISSGTTFIELNKFLTVNSQGSIGGLAAASAVYEVPLDSSGETATEGPETYVADTSDFVPDSNALGQWEEADVDGDTALKSTGERLVDTMSVGDTIDVLIDAAITIRNNISGFLRRFFWSGIVVLLQLASDVLDALDVLDTQVSVPDELGRPKAFAYYDWWTAGFDMVEYWQDNANTLSYDVQAKYAVIPDQDYYMAGLFLRSDNDVANGGNTLGVSIIRGDSTWTDVSGEGDGIPDAVLPVNRTGTDSPLIVLWAQRDLDGDDFITPGWTYTSPTGGGTITIWPEEREWLAWAALPTNYCLLDSGSDSYFADWMTLAVRIHEQVLTAPSGSFSAGDRVNDIRVWLTTTSDCGGGGSASTGIPASFQLDNRRNGQARYQSGTAAINWPLFDMDNFTASYDTFSLVGGNAAQIQWQEIKASPTSLGFTVDLTGTTGDKEHNAVIRTDAYTTESYDDTGYPGSHGFPEEVGMHTFGTNEGVIYVDDFAIRFMGQDPTTGGGTGFFPPVLN